MPQFCAQAESELHGSLVGCWRRRWQAVLQAVLRVAVLRVAGLWLGLLEVA